MIDDRELYDRCRPDGGQMLLLAGFLLSATAIVAIGSMMALQTGETQVAEERTDPMVKLFLNSRRRAIDFFDQITANDTALSVENRLDEYLYSQYQTARSLSLDLNSSLAAPDQPSPKAEDGDFLHDHGSNGTDGYATLGDDLLESQDGEECYGHLPYDGTNDGVIENQRGDVVGAIVWLKIESANSWMEEYLIIDVDSTSVATTC